MGAIQYPLISGQRYSFASVELTLPGMPPLTLFSEISYTQTLDPGMIEGNSPIVQGFTIGSLKAEGSFGMYEEEDANFVQGLGAGFLTQQFTIVVNYTSNAFGTVTDTIIGARIKSGAKTMQKGNEGIVVKRDFVCIKILENGIDPLPPT